MNTIRIARAAAVVPFVAGVLFLGSQTATAVSLHAAAADGPARQTVTQDFGWQATPYDFGWQSAPYDFGWQSVGA